MNWCKSHFDYLVLIGSLIIASVTRIALPFQLVFNKGTVVFNSIDAYYQLRFADLIATHYPRMDFIDVYTNMRVGDTPFFNLLLVWLSKIFGNLDVVAAYLPAILGILTLIPIFIIATKLFNNKWITSLAVLLAAILPGEFLNRTQLGAADYHCLEIFLTTTMMMFVVLGLTAKNQWHKISFGILAVGTFLLYFYTWRGNLVFIAIMAVFLYIWFGFRWAKEHPSIKHNVILHSLVLVVAIGHICFTEIGRLVGMFAWGTGSLSSEELPLLLSLSSAGDFVDLRIAWGYFGFGFFLFLVGLGMVAYRIIKYRQSPEMLLLAWSIVMFGLTLAMRRWTYYFAVNVAILSAYSCFVIGSALAVKERAIKIRAFSLCIAFLVLLILVPLGRNSVAMVRNPANYMSQDWQEATQWLHNEMTPGQDAEYYEKHASTRVVPLVLSWWDYGYWIVRESHMRTVSHSGATLGRELGATLFLNDNTEEVVCQLQEMGVKYVVVDNLMVAEKFYAIVVYAQLDLDDYYVYEGLELQRTPKYWGTFLSQLYYFNAREIDGIELVFPVERSGFTMGYEYYVKWVPPSGVKIFEVVE